MNGEVDPDTWILDRKKGNVLKWKSGHRKPISNRSPLLNQKEINALHQHIRKLAKSFEYEPDIEWAGSSSKLKLLQIRPITSLKKNKNDKRQWYLSLRLKPAELRKLCKKVNEEIIPEMERDGESLAGEDFSKKSRQTILNSLQVRLTLLRKWRRVYKKDLIPFADGARSFGIFYNELIQPEDPYEFVSLLQSKDLLSLKRNQALVATYETGERGSETHFKNGKREGLETYWYKSGEKWLEFTSRNGKKEGLETSWYQNGQKKEEVPFKRGKIDGVLRIWYENGREKCTKNFKDGTEHGKRIEWDENGNKIHEANFVDGHTE